jgi:hypothetical protein
VLQKGVQSVVPLLTTVILLLIDTDLEIMYAPVYVKKKSNTNNIDKKWTPYNINESQEKHFCLNPPHVCVYPKPGHGLLKPHVVVFFALSDFRREVVVLFVDIGGIVSTFCYNYTKKKRNRSEQIHKAWSLQPSTRTETCLNSFTKAWAYQTPAKKKPV